MEGDIKPADIWNVTIRIYGFMNYSPGDVSVFTGERRSMNETPRMNISEAEIGLLGAMLPSMFWVPVLKMYFCVLKNKQCNT